MDSFFSSNVEASKLMLASKLAVTYPSFDYRLWRLCHTTMRVGFGTEVEECGLVKRPMIRMYPRGAQMASSEWMVFQAGKRRTSQYSWSRSSKRSLRDIFSSEAASVEPVVFVPHSLSDVLDIFVEHDGQWYLVHFMVPEDRPLPAERMFELICSLNGVAPAALGEDTDVTIPDHWNVPSLLYPVPSKDFGGFSFQRIKCWTTMLPPSKRERLEQELATKVKQFKIAAPLPNATEEPAQSKLVQLDKVGELLRRCPDEDTKSRCASVLQRLFDVGKAQTSTLLEVLKARSVADTAARGGEGDDGADETKDAAEDPLERFLQEQPACSFLNHSDPAHATWSIGDRAFVKHTESGHKRGRCSYK